MNLQLRQPRMSVDAHGAQLRGLLEFPLGCFEPSKLL